MTQLTILDNSLRGTVKEEGLRLEKGPVFTLKTGQERFNWGGVNRDRNGGWGVFRTKKLRYSRKSPSKKGARA